MGLQGSSLEGRLAGSPVHRFDTGLFRSQRSEIRLAIMDQLSVLLKSSGRYVSRIVALPRPFRGEGDDEGEGLLEDALGGQAPALAVAIGDKTYQATGMGGTQMNAEIDLHVYAVGANARNRTDGRLSTDVAGAASISADPGVEALLEHVEELLIGQPCSVAGVTDLAPKHEAISITRAAITVWEQVYALTVQRDVDPDRVMDEVLETIEGLNNLDGVNNPSLVVDTVSTLEVE